MNVLIHLLYIHTWIGPRSTPYPRDRPSGNKSCTEALKRHPIHWLVHPRKPREANAQHLPNVARFFLEQWSGFSGKIYWNPCFIFTLCYFPIKQM